MMLEPQDQNIYPKCSGMPILCIPIPDHLQDEMEFLRELYPYSQLIGELICMAEERFGFCEFAKGIQDQRIELACYQFWGMIQRLYTQEKAALFSAGMPIGTL